MLLSVLRADSRRFVTALCFAAMLAASGCSGSGLSGLGGKKDDSGKNTDTDTDSEAGNEPAEVAGAFLCGPAGDYTSPEGQVSYGCAVKREDSPEKVAGEATDAKARLTIGSAAALDLSTVIAPAESQWHFFFSVPSTAPGKALTLEVKVKINGQPFAATFDKLESQVQIQIGVDTDGEVCDCPETETGTGTGYADFPPESRILFVTEAVHLPSSLLGTSSQFHGVKNSDDPYVALLTTSPSADEHCARAAEASSIAEVSSRSFFALITGEGRNVKELFDGQSYEIYSVDGARVGIAGKMIDEGIKGPILTENGHPLPDEDRAWTGMSADGSAAGENCSDWTQDEDEEGESGIPSGLGTAWFNDQNASNLDCEGERANVEIPTHLYCLSKPD